MFALHRQTRSLAKRFVFGIVVVFLLALTSHTAKAFLPIGIAVGAGMVGGAMQDESSRKQQSQQSEQYQRSQSATERKPKKKPPKPKIRNRMTHSQKSRRPRQSRLSLSLTRHRPNR